MRTCKTCGAAIQPTGKRGRPSSYCDEHKLANQNRISEPKPKLTRSIEPISELISEVDDKGQRGSLAEWSDIIKNDLTPKNPEKKSQFEISMITRLTGQILYYVMECVGKSKQHRHTTLTRPEAETIVQGLEDGTWFYDQDLRHCRRRKQHE